MVYDPVSAQYWLFYALPLTSSSTIYRQTASAPTGTWSAQTSYSLTIPGPGAASGNFPWHMGAPVKIGSKWVLAFSDTNSLGRDLWLASSPDGTTWTVAVSPLDVVRAYHVGQARISTAPPSQTQRDGSELLKLWYSPPGRAPSGARGTTCCLRW